MNNEFEFEDKLSVSLTSGVASITHSTHVRTKITKLGAQNMNHGNKTLFFEPVFFSRINEPHTFSLLYQSSTDKCNDH